MLDGRSRLGRGDICCCILRFRSGRTGIGLRCWLGPRFLCSRTSYGQSSGEITRDLVIGCGWVDLPCSIAMTCSFQPWFVVLRKVDWILWSCTLFFWSSSSFVARFVLWYMLGLRSKESQTVLGEQFIPVLEV